MFGSIRIRRCVGSLFASTLALVLAFPSHGLQDCTVPASPTVRTLRRSDGSLIELHCRGNGLNHWYEDPQGFPVVKTDAGYFFGMRGSDGRLVATEGLVGASDPRRLGIQSKVVPAPARQESARTARGVDPRYPGPRGSFLMGSGTAENLVLLLRFSNHGPSGQNRTLPSSADVSAIMNEPGGDPLLAPTGSVRDYYLENSYGQLVLDSTVVGWLDMPNAESYYAGGQSGIDPDNPMAWELIADGLNAADPLVDFSDFDENGDGWIDAITFLHSGYGAEFWQTDQYGTAPEDRIWSHKWAIPTWTSAEGVSVSAYNISAGLWDASGSDPFRIGVVSHELGHYFGLPDLYDTDGTSVGAGDWCGMGSGAWGFDGTQHYPTQLSAWCKLKLGWVLPDTILPGSYSAPRVEDNPTIYMIDSGYPPGEYLLIENRQALMFDQLIPQGGLAVWHVDESKGSLTFNDPNNDEGYPGQLGWPGNDNHYRVELLQADGFFDLETFYNYGDSIDLYRVGLATVLDASTSPDTDAYQAGTVVTNFNRLQGIGASSSNMAFTYVNNTAPTITTSAFLFPRRTQFYSKQLTSTGGTGPYTWSHFRPDAFYDWQELASSPTSGGVAQNFKADEGRWTVDLPFRFPFYETDYSRVYVSPNGCIDLVPLEDEPINTAAALRFLPRIAGLWDDLTTNGGVGQDIYLDTSVSGQARFRWQAETVEGGLPVNFAITLHKNGRIRFDYGAGNTGLTPTVGVSRGHGDGFVLIDSHDNASTLTNANSVELELEPQMPFDFSLSSSGLLTGTANVLVAFTFRARVTDSAGRYDQKQFFAIVLPKKWCKRWSAPVRPATF